MGNYKNPFLKDNEKRYNFVPYMKLKKVKQVPRNRFRQKLRSSIPLGQVFSDRGTDQIIH